MIVLDANVLINSVNDSAVQHVGSRDWLEATFNSNETVGFDWTVLLAFVRLVTNRRIFPEPMAADEAMGFVTDWLAQPNALVLSPDAIHATVLGDLLRKAGTAGNLVNDAHLAALALESGATVASFDADFNRFGVKWVQPDA